MVVQRLQQIDLLKDDFLAKTSHELRTPLNGIVGLAESMKDGVGGRLSKANIENLSMIISSGKRLAHLINDLLDFSKLKESSLTLNRKAVNVRAVADVVLCLLKPLVGRKQLTLIDRIAENTQLVWADEERLTQVLTNLIGNAIKFTQSGSVIVEAEIESNFLKVSVIDTGMGIAPEDHERIFYSFEQVDEAFASAGGTGLGLAVSKQLVELHGGELSLSSVLGQGSTFSLTLPLYLEDKQQSSVRDRPTGSFASAFKDGELVLYAEDESYIPGTDGANVEWGLDDGLNMPHILIVDDEPINLRVLINHLSLKNYRITEATDGDSALNYLESDHTINLILLDVMMPNKSGFEVCEILRRSHSMDELPIIFLTANNQQSNVMKGFEVGGNDYLTKPVDKDELLSTCRGSFTHE